MRLKPRVGLIDEDPQIKQGWETALGCEADLVHFPDAQSLFEQAKSQPDLIQSLDCVIIGRYLNQNTVDVFESNIPEALRAQGVSAIFLNWQGYLTKEEINIKFEGRLFNRYGVRWQTLRSRIQKTKTKKVPGSAMKKGSSKPETLAQLPEAPTVLESNVTHLRDSSKIDSFYLSKPQRCQELLKQMARHAGGRHKERLEYYANEDQSSGIQLLEAIYNRLLTDKERSQTCPSRYINSSPVVAKSILQKALFG